MIALTATEIEAVATLETRERLVRRGAVLQRENDATGDLFVLRSGLMMTYVMLSDGSRQILRFLFPGDMVGVSTLAYSTTPESVCALSESVVCPFDKAALSLVMEAHPRIAAMILVFAQVERATLTDRLAAIGRNPARSRLAALLLELRNRLRAMDRSIGDTFHLGLTQEEIGDATGLTSVHVNRMFRQLGEDGLIARENGRVTIRDEGGLIRVGAYVDRYRGLDLGWLPAGR